MEIEAVLSACIEMEIATHRSGRKNEKHWKWRCGRPCYKIKTTEELLVPTGGVAEAEAQASSTIGQTDSSEGHGSGD